MPKLFVTTREDEVFELTGEADESAMEAMRDGGVDELLAICGGCVSCATCHVYVDSQFFARLEPMGDDEAELLESSGVRREFSRLSCQIPLSDELDGLRITIAPEA